MYRSKLYPQAPAWQIHLPGHIRLLCRTLLLSILITAGNKTFGQIVLDTTSTNPTCTRSFTHNYTQVGNGSIGIIASGGTAPYTYLLNGSLVQGAQTFVNITQNNGYFPGLIAGWYTVRVTDANGLQVFYTVTLTNIVPQPVISQMYVTSSPSTCTSADGSMIIIGSGGTPPYVYSIDGGLTYTSSDTLTGLRQGVYAGILMDANGCLAELIPNYSPYPAQDCGIVGGLEYFGITGCSSDATITADASHSTFPFHDTDPWNFSYDGINYHPGNDGASQDTASGFSPGIHTMYIKDTVTGQIAVSDFNIVKSCYIYITFVNVDASCQQSDGSITVIAASGTAPYTYSIDGVHYQSSNVFTGLATGNYSVTVKDANGEVSFATATVYNKCPFVTLTGTDETCGQANGTITATGHKGTLPYSFSIDGSSFQPGNIFTGLASGTHTVTIQDNNGFTSITAITIHDDCLQLNLTPVNTTCSRSNGSITASGANGTAPYLYSIDGINFQANASFTGLAAGPYTISIRDAAGLTNTGAITLTDAPSPQIGPTSTQASCSNSGGSISVIRTRGTAPFQYSIDNGSVFQADSVFNNLDSGQYLVVVKDSNGCVSNGAIHLTALPTPYVFIGNDTTLCEGATITLNAPDSAGYQYQWQDNSNQQTYTVTGPGAYSVKVTNTFNCPASASINILFRPLPIFSLGNDSSLCNGQTLLEKPAIQAGETCLWNTGSTATTMTITSPGLYWLKVSDNGCASSDSITVSYKPLPVVSLGKDSGLCDGQTLTLDASYGNSTYLWQDGSTQPTFTVSNAGNYKVKVTENGCDTSAQITVNYISKPIVSLVADTTICITQQLVLDASYPNSTYAWQDGSTQPQFKVAKEGTYTVNVTNECGTTMGSTIATFEDCACKFVIPGAFTPNGDGNNDLFLPKYLCLFTSYQLKVYNRWGQLIFASANPSDGWDGTMGGRPQPAGVYVWEMAFRDSLTGKLLQKNGTVILIR
jgi:gliding motility-associated-like protein